MVHARLNLIALLNIVLYVLQVMQPVARHVILISLLPLPDYVNLINVQVDSLIMLVLVVALLDHIKVVVPLVLLARIRIAWSAILVAAVNALMDSILQEIHAIVVSIIANNALMA